MKNILFTLIFFSALGGLAQGLQVIYPNATTDTLQAGAVNTIKWRNTAYPNGVALRYSLDGGFTYQYMAYRPGTDSTFNWSAPANLVSDQFILEVADGPRKNFDRSDAPGVIKIGNAVGIATPKLGNFTVGQVTPIDIRGGGTHTSVTLAYNVNYGAYTTIATNVPTNAIYNWTVPNDTGVSVSLRVTSTTNTSVNSTLYNSFSITTNPQNITVTYPNGGELLTEGDQDTIRWAASLNLTGTQVYFDYSLDSGVSWNNIGDESAEVGKAAWKLPLHVSSTRTLVRVRSNSVANVADTSDAVFTIQQGAPEVTINYPTGGEKFLADANRYINYETKGGLDTLNAYVSADGGSTYTFISGGYDAKGFGGQVMMPDVQTDSAMLKFEDASNNTVFGLTDSLFKIRRIIISQPSQFGSTSYYHGQSNSILWSAANSVGDTLAIYLSVDNQQTWRLLSDTTLTSSQSMNWDIPSDSSTQCFIKIEDKANPSNFDISGIPFSILPQPIKVLSPNGGEFIQRATPYTIRWSNNDPSITHVKLEYSLNGGSSWSSITNYTQDSGSYVWNVPFTSTSNAKVKVSKAWSTTVYDESNAPFNIVVTPPTLLTLTSPTGGEKLPLGGTHNITWNSTGTIDSVDIYLIYVGGNNILLADNEANDGSYTWQLPSFNACCATVAIVKSGDVTVADTSNVFQVESQFQLLKPNGGEVLTGNSSYLIDWTSFGSFYGLSYHYSLDSGNTWTAIATMQNDTGSYPWWVPNMATQGALIAVQGFDNGALRADTSDSYFSINPFVASFTLQAPNGGEIFQSGDTTRIRWSGQGSIGSVELRYSLDSGATWIFLDDNLPVTGSYLWTVPTANTTTALVRINGFDGATFVTDSSDATFSINPPPPSGLILTQPNGGDSIYTETFYTINWNRLGTTGDVSVYFSDDLGATYTLVEDSLSGNSYSWFTPVAPSNDCFIYITDGTYGDTSDAKFYLLPTIGNTVELARYTFNNGMANDAVRNYDGVRKDITHRTDRFGCANRAIRTDVDNYITMGDVMDSLFTGTDTSFSFSFWTNGASLQDDGPIISKNIRNLCGSNGHQFEIYKFGGQLHITAYYDLAANNYSKVRTSQIILQQNQWNHVVVIYDGSVTSAHVDRFRVFINNQLVPLLNFGSTGMMGDIPDGPSSLAFGANVFGNGNNCGTQFTSWLDDVSIFGGKLSAFQVSQLYTDSTACPSNSLVIDSVRSLGKLSFGDTAQVYYTASSGVSQITVLYSLDEGETFITDTTSVAASGVYHWAIPDTTVMDAIFRIEEVGNDEVFDETRSLWIEPRSITATLPVKNGKPSLTAGASYFLRWNTTGNIDSVQFFFSSDSGATYTQFMSNTFNSEFGNPTSLAINLPNVSSQNCFMVFRDVRDTTVADTVDFSLTFPPKGLTITSPNGGNYFYPSSTQNITWTTLGTVDSVNLYLSTDSGITYSPIASNVLNTNSYSWTVPSAQSGTCLIAIEDAADLNTTDTSDAVFRIDVAPTLTVLHPTVGDTIEAYHTDSITWVSQGFVGSVDVLYSPNNGASWLSVATAVPNSGHVTWNTPYFTNTNWNTTSLVRVQSSGNTSVGDTSSVFTVGATGPVELLTPNGGEVYTGGSVDTARWDGNGNWNQSYLHLSVDSGQTWVQLTDMGIRQERASWNVPNITSTGCLMAFAGDTSDTFFTINANNVSLDEEALLSAVRVFPNPVQHVLTIKANTPVLRLVLVNMLGQQVKEVMNKNEIEVSKLPVGTYILMVETLNGFIHQQRIIKQ